jgi:hypothetical protein
MMAMYFSLASVGPFLNFLVLEAPFLDFLALEELFPD